LSDAEHGKRRVPPATFCWDDVVPSMSAASRVTPEVTIVKHSARGTFEPLLIDGITEDDSGVNFVTVAGLASSGDRVAPRSEWCTVWLGDTAVTDPLHFRVHTLRGAAVTSPPITRRSKTWPRAWRDR
jgi:hypothetical protein